MFNQYDTPSDKEIMQKVRMAVAHELALHKAAGVPSVIYDRETKKSYAVHADGRKVFLADKLLKGNYSERIDTEKARDHSVCRSKRVRKKQLDKLVKTKNVVCKCR